MNKFGSSNPALARPIPAFIYSLEAIRKIFTRPHWFFFFPFVIHSKYQGPQTRSIFQLLPHSILFWLFGMQRIVRMLLTGIVGLTLSVFGRCSASTIASRNPEAAMSTVRVKLLRRLPNVNSFEYFQSLGGDHPFTWICLHRLPSNNR